jgi:acyl carrier protein
MLQKRGAPPATAGQNLRDAGLTSLDLVNLMLAVEGEFDIVIPQDAMTPDNFQTLDAIKTLVCTLKPAA